MANRLDPAVIDEMAQGLARIRENHGRLFIIGVGGGAGHASHAVNDFRKLCDIDAISPLDNVSELTARINDDGWNTSIIDSLLVSKINESDALLVISVGGGSKDPDISGNIVSAVEHAKNVRAQVFGIVGRSTGVTAMIGDVVIVIEGGPKYLETPLVEGFQAIIWHLLVTHPALKTREGTWESLGKIVEVD